MKRLISFGYNRIKKYNRLLFHRLEILHLESTNFCNLECRCCHRKDVMVRKKQHMNSAHAKKIIDEASQIGIKCIYLHMWGEPLMNKNLEEIISYAVLKGIPSVKFTSNGVLLSQERARSLIHSGLHELTISFIGNSPENYEYLMQGAKYNQVVQNIENFLSIRNSLKKRTPLLRLQTVLMDSTAGELKAFYGYWKNRVDSIQLNYITQPSYLPVNFSEELTELRNNINQENRLICEIPFNTMTILADGSIVSSCCEDLNGDFIWGNAGTDSLKRIWNSNEYNCMRKNIRNRNYDEVPICRSCVNIFKDIVQFKGMKIEEYKKNELKHVS